MCVYIYTYIHVYVHIYMHFQTTDTIPPKWLNHGEAAAMSKTSRGMRYSSAGWGVEWYFMNASYPYV